MAKSRDVMGTTRLLCLMLSSLIFSGPSHAASVPTAPPLATLQSLSEPWTHPIRRPLTIKGYKTLSGTKILFIRTRGLPMFDAHVSFVAGSAHTAHQPGLAAMTYGLLNEGVAGKDVNAIQETFDGLGAKLGMDINHDRANFSLRSLSDESRRAPALELFAQVLGKPLLAQDSLPAVKSKLLHLMDVDKQSHATEADQALMGMLFPGHGYAQSIYGTGDGLASITRAQVQAFHRQAYAAGNALITLVGDLSEEDAQHIGAQIADALPQGAAIAALGTPVSPSGTQRLLRVERSSAQAHLRLAQPSVPRNDPDYLALRIASRIFTTRLMTDLRERRGLTYDVYAGITPLQAQEILAIELQIRPNLADAVLARIKEMFEEFLTDGPTQKELDNAQLRLTGSEPLKTSSNRQILARLYDIGVNDLALELDYSTQKTLELSLQSVKNALNRHYDAQRWHVVILGPTIDQEPLPTFTQSEANAMCRANDEFVAS